jgi:hypothetical protein
MTLEHVDWAGATIGLVRAGAGAPADPQSLIRYIDECPDVELLLSHGVSDLRRAWRLRSP